MPRSPRYEQDRELIIATLEARGWELTADGELTEAADLACRGKTFALRVSHFTVSEQRAFNLFITHSDGRELLYMVECNDKLPAVLAALVELQDHADEKNLSRYLGRLHEASEEMYQYDGDEPIPISA